MKLNLKFPIKQRITDSIKQDDIHLPKTDRLYWFQSSKRHNPNYYNLLNSSLLFLTFGGYYETKPILYQPYTTIDKINRKPNFWQYNSKKKQNKDFSDEVFIFQQDNFRFWEVLYSQSTPVNISFDYWNFILPETPIEGKHYLAISRLNAKNLEAELSNLSSEEIKKIGKAGKEWCKKHYSPTAAAQRILTYLNLENG